MEITSDKIFSLIEKKMNKNKNNNKKTLLTIEENEILTDGLIFNNSYISKIYFNSINKKALYNFENLQYLSLTHNSIRNIDFLKHFPNLFYLDLYKNSIDDFKVLNKKNIFGYIRLSIDHFNEKKILQIHNLTAIIFEINLRDTQLNKNIIYNNPNILILNNKINYIIDKIITKEQSKRNYKRMATHHIMRLNSTLNTEEEVDIDINDIKKNHNKDLEINNPALLKIKKFYDIYSSQIDNIISIQKINTSNELSQCKDYLEIEKQKLMILYEFYLEMTKLNNNINNYYINNPDYRLVNEKINKIQFYNMSKIFLNDSKVNQKLQVKLIILITFLFLSLNIISKKMCIMVLNFILEKFYHMPKDKLIPIHMKLRSIFLISIYFYIYEKCEKTFKTDPKNIFYDKIVKILSMDKLILKGNILFEYILKNKNESRKGKFNNKKTLINHKISFIQQIDILEEIIILIQFYYDFILYEKMDKILLNSEISGEYIIFIEIKETLHQQKLEQTKFFSLTDKNFKKTQFDILNHQFYFSQEKNKLMRDKIFPPRKKFKVKFKKYYNFDNDYISKDDFKSDDILKVNKVIQIHNNFVSPKSHSRNKTKHLLDIMNLSEVKPKKYFTYNNFYKITKRNNENEKELNKLISIINNDALLSEHSRYIIKNEKLKKKLLMNKKRKKEKTEKLIQTNKTDSNNISINNISIINNQYNTNNNNNLLINSNHMIHLEKRIKELQPEFYSVKPFFPFSYLTTIPNFYNIRKKSIEGSTNEYNSFISAKSFHKESTIKKIDYNKNIGKPIKLISPSLENIFKKNN